MSPPSSPRRCVLVVDDDRAIRELVSTRLTLAGYDVFNACDGVEAMTRIVTLRPHGIVLDLNMPRLDGFSVLERIGRDTAQRIPILVLTARNSPADVKKAIELGARDYLAKPFTDSQLLARVGRLFRRPMEDRRPDHAFEMVEELLEAPPYLGSGESPEPMLV